MRPVGGPFRLHNANVVRKVFTAHEARYEVVLPAEALVERAIVIGRGQEGGIVEQHQTGIDIALRDNRIDHFGCDVRAARNTDLARNITNAEDGDHHPGIESGRRREER